MNYETGNLLEVLVLMDAPFNVKVILPDRTEWLIHLGNIDLVENRRPRVGEKLQAVVLGNASMGAYGISIRKKQVKELGRGEVLLFGGTSGRPGNETKNINFGDAVEKRGSAQNDVLKVGGIVRAMVTAVSGFVIVLKMPDGRKNWVNPKTIHSENYEIGDYLEFPVLELRNDGRYLLGGNVLEKPAL